MTTQITMLPRDRQQDSHDGVAAPRSRSSHCHSLCRVLCLATVALAAVTAACDLSSVEIPIGEPLIVVHAVMRSDRNRQFIVVEQSFTGTVDEMFLGNVIPTEGSPALPVEGATVQVTNVDLPDDTCGSPVRFGQDLAGSPVQPVAGVYWAPAGCPSMRPGDSLELYVETADGQIVTGSALVTGMESASLTVLGETIPFGADTVVTFNRDRDILRLSVEPISGRLLQVAVLRVGELDMWIGEDIWPGARIDADTMSLAIPGDLVDAGGWSDGGDVFRAGRDYIMTVAVTDANYYDFSRSRSNRFTGRGFLNRLTGGIGVFGSLAAKSLDLRVVGDFDDEREGEYWLRGTLQGITIDVTLTVYATRSREDTEASGLLTGDWLWLGPIGEGDVGWLPWQADTLAFEGTLEGNAFRLAALQPKHSGNRVGMGRITLLGDRKPDASFVLSVADSMRLRSIPLGNLTVTQR